MEAGWHVLCAVLCHGYWFIIYPVIHVFIDQVLDTNTIDFGWSFYSIALYTLTVGKVADDVHDFLHAESRARESGVTVCNASKQGAHRQEARRARARAQSLCLSGSILDPCRMYANHSSSKPSLGRSIRKIKNAYISD